MTVLVLLIALAVGSYLNRAENRSAFKEDAIQSKQAAPDRDEAVRLKESKMEVPATTEMPL